MMDSRTAIHVRRNEHGWWVVRRPDGEVLARYLSELQAWDAARSAAESSACDLVFDRGEGPPQVELFDQATQRLKPAGGPRERGAAAGRSANRRLILLVEDMVEARELYAHYLSYAGFSVVTAINGHEAIRLAGLLRPDLILMDIRLPGMDGLEATADIKSDPDLAHIPIIAVTGDPSDDIGERARRAGCAGVIPKPAFPDEIARRIKAFLQTPQQPSGS